MKKINISQFSHNRPGDMNYRKPSEQKHTSGQRRVQRLAEVAAKKERVVDRS